MPIGRKGRKTSTSQMKLEIELSNRLIEENMDSNWGVCVCEATGLSIARPSKMNAAHILGKGANPAARLDPDNIVIVLQSVHKIMDDIGVSEDSVFEELANFLPEEIRNIPVAMDNLKEFFNELPYRVELMKSKYKKVSK